MLYSLYGTKLAHIRYVHAFAGASLPILVFWPALFFVPFSLSQLSCFLFVINILMRYCLFTSSSIAVGLQSDALKPLVRLIPDLLAASKLSSFNSHRISRKFVFMDTYFSFYIPRSKTDQYGSGSTRVVTRTGNPTCPFNMLYADTLN